jgi:sulfoquinovosidase
VLAALALAAALPGTASAATVASGSLSATVHEDPWHIEYNAVDEAPRTLGFTGAGGLTAHATKATGGHMEGRAYVATLQTDDPLGRTIAVRVAPAGDGIIEVTATGPPGADTMSVGFERQSGERYLGFGERSDQVVRSGGDVKNHVEEGPYQESENSLISAFVPPAGFDPRPDATYFPIPWLLSTHGYGVLLDSNATSRFHLNDPWTMDVDSSTLAYKVYAGPKPADVLSRFSADVGRQPPAAAPFYFGPWWQPKGDPAQNIDTLKAAGALGSLAMTYTHYLPCGNQQGHTAEEQAKTAQFHAAGLAVTTYFNPMICTTYQPPYDQAANAHLLHTTPLGQPYVYRYTGANQFLVGQFDFTNPAAVSFYGDLLSEAVANGYDGWMEDFGEYTPPDAQSSNGTPGPEMHNEYPTLYHGAAYTYSHDRSPRPLARFNRSGWIGAAKVSQIVWGGDPTTGFGFDGLESAVRNGLSMGLSGVSMWGSDIGGYFAISQPQTTPDLERRWIEVGFASGVMRTEADGFTINTANPRAQIFDPEVLPVWARYAKLRTQLYPYLSSAQRTYDKSGMPMMRQLALVYPDDDRAAQSDDEYLFGPDLLVAPVLTADTTKRKVYLPPGKWIDFWRSASLGDNGAPKLNGPEVLDGGRTVEVAAPNDQIPMFVRAGAIVPLLPSDVQTLSNYGSGVVHLNDRPDKRALMAWPQKGLPPSTAQPTDDSSVKSGMHKDKSWVLRVSQKVRRTLDLQVALPKKPCALLVNKKRRPFTFSGGILRATPRLASGTVEAATTCPKRSRR